MNSVVKNQKENLLKQSQQFTQQYLDGVMKQNPNLTRNGLELPSTEDYAANRQYLKDSLEAFQLCCAYLSLCKRSKTPCRESLHSGYLKGYVERLMGTYVPSGSIVAAAEAIGIKYYSDIAKTPYVKLYISSKLPFAYELECIA